MTIREIETINEVFIDIKSNKQKIATIFIRYENGESSSITVNVENLTIFNGTGLVIIRNGKHTTIIPCEHIVQIDFQE
jgi:hypothetical protein